MPGGLLNIVAYGELNSILNGNPSKTFFKTTYAKYTNFGLQKFRIDYKGLKSLRLTDDSTFTFEIPSHGDLLMDTYFSVKLPDIYSPIYADLSSNLTYDLSFVQPYEFKWIKNLGFNMIKNIRFMIDGTIIQEFTGHYLYNMIQRDFSDDKKKLVDEMTGNTRDLNDPANYSNRNGNYPNASNNNFGINDWINGPEPSIRGRRIYIPLNILSTLISEMALPLVSIEYSKVYIEIVCRPIQELFVIRDTSWLNTAAEYNKIVTGSSYAWSVADRYNYYNPPYIAPSFNNPAHQMFYFLHAPPYNKYYVTGTSYDTTDPNGSYLNITNSWDQDIHLIANYSFLDKEERRFFAGRPQNYLIKQVSEKTNYNVLNTQRARIDNKGLTTSFMWFFQRTDVNLRNQWSNYTNWEDDVAPYPCILSNDISLLNVNPYPPEYPTPSLFNSQTHKYSNLFVTGPFHIENQKNIMTNWGLIIDSQVRETIFDAGITNYTEKYTKTTGNSESGLYCYNFCLTTDPYSTQPTGAINLSKFTDVEFEYSTIQPFDLSYVSQQNQMLNCDISGNILGVDKPNIMDYQYKYNLHIMQETYNVLNFNNGLVSFTFSQ